MNNPSKWRETMLLKYGTEEAVLAEMKRRAAIGGRIGGKAGGIEYSKYGRRPKGAAKRQEIYAVPRGHERI